MRRVDLLPADGLGVTACTLGVRLWLEVRGRGRRTEVSVLLDVDDVEALRAALDDAGRATLSLAAAQGRVGHA